jgi:hypothetical protein
MTSDYEKGPEEPEEISMDFGLFSKAPAETIL